jgi:hypothetical protein
MRDRGVFEEARLVADGAFTGWFANLQHDYRAL